jgi:hypothetical protein
MPCVRQWKGRHLRPPSACLGVVVATQADGSRPAKPGHRSARYKSGCPARGRRAVSHASRPRPDDESSLSCSAPGQGLRPVMRLQSDAREKLRNQSCAISHAFARCGPRSRAFLSVAPWLARKGKTRIDATVRESAGCSRQALFIGPEVAQARITPVTSLQAVRVIVKGHLRRSRG